MKNSFFILLLSFITACQAETPPKGDQFQRVFTVISSEKVFAMPFSGLMKQLSPLCKPNTRKDSDLEKDGNVECAKETEVLAMDVTGTATPSMTIITGTFAGLDHCEYMRQVLTKQYGRPHDSSGACNAHWKMKPGKNGRQRSIGLESGKNAPVVYFSIAEEQGP